MDDEIKLRKHKQFAHSDSGANLKLSPSRAHMLGGMGAQVAMAKFKTAELTLGIFPGEAKSEGQHLSEIQETNLMTMLTHK